MGNILRKLFGIKSAKVDNENEDNENEVKKEFNEYDDDVQDATNLALAMQQDDNTTNYEITISCENLPKMDTLSLTDPIVVVYLKTIDDYKEIGKTECIRNTLDPKFSKSFIISYNPEESQWIRFEVYDIDNEKEKHDLSKQEEIGKFECKLEEIILSQGEAYTKPIEPFNPRKKKRLGRITIKAFESDIGQAKVWFVFGVEDFITRNFIKFSISGSTNNKEYFKIHDSPKVKNTQKGCVFPKFSVNSNKIADESSNMKFEFFEVRKNANKLLGELEISLVGLYNASNKKINIYKNNLIVGKLKIIESIKEKKNTFLNYIYEGYCLKTITAIDMTRKTNKFFKVGRNRVDFKKEYSSAIMNIGKLLHYYDDDLRHVILGFGAKLPPLYNVVSHNFAINNNYFIPCVEGLEKMVDYYHKMEAKVEKSGPVLFSEILSYSMELARHFKETNKKQYLVLFILTGGEVGDVKMTLNLLKKAEDLPLSVLAIGIGDSEFKILEQLKKNDSDFPRVKNEKRERNVFNFLKYDDCKESQEKLANSTFSEIPRQFLEYMKMMKIVPKKTKDSKNKWSKREIRRKLESRKKKNVNKVHPIVKYLQPLQTKFEKSFKPLGYDIQIVERILKEGIPAHSFNLMTEIISQIEQERTNHVMKPIQIASLYNEEVINLKGMEGKEGMGMIRKLEEEEFIVLDEEMNEGAGDDSESFEDEEDIKDYVLDINAKEKTVRIEKNEQIRRKILPQRMQLFTRDKIPLKKTEEWMKMKKQTHTKTQNLLMELEERELMYQQKQLPGCLLPEPRKMRMRRKKKDETIDPIQE